MLCRDNIIFYFGFSAVLLACLTTSPKANAELTLNAGLRQIYERNVNGAPDTSKDNQLRDTHTNLSASAVYYTTLGEGNSTYFIGQVGAQSSYYHRYSNLHNSMANASVGLYKQFSSAWSGQFTGRGYTRETRQRARDANGWGTTLELKNQLTPTVWVKGVADYENSDANASYFSYTAQTLGLSLGYLPWQNTFINVGFSEVKRDFNTAIAFHTTTHTLFTEVSQKLAKNWYVTGSYAYQNNESNIANTAYTNQILSLGVAFSY